MGQVPNIKNSYLLIGNGRVARHFRRYFDLLGLPFQTWFRFKADDSPKDHQTPQPASLVNLIEESDRILLLISDSAIESFIESHPELKSRPLVHFSGSHVSEFAIGAHPLMTFGGQLYDFDTYKQIPFVLESGRGSFSEILPGLPNPNYAISSQLKPLYHALCVMGGNFGVILWQKVFAEFETQLGLPADLLYPYLQQISQNLQTDPSRALTGPLARRDVVTIERNLEALQGDAFQNVYEAFVKAVTPDLLDALKHKKVRTP